MTKQKAVCQYELLCLIDKKDTEEYKNFIENIKSFSSFEQLKEIKEENWKPAYKINHLAEPAYVLIYFTSLREKIASLEKNILHAFSKNFLSRYKLINLTDEKRNKIKIQKDVKQN